MNGTTYNEAWGMSPKQRANILEFLTDTLKRENAAMTGQQQM